jgi:hypothetical protein
MRKLQPTDKQSTVAAQSEATLVIHTTRSYPKHSQPRVKNELVINTDLEV